MLKTHAFAHAKLSNVLEYSWGCGTDVYALEYDHTEVGTMPTNERVTVTLPAEVVRDVDRLEKNRSKFVLEAVRHELKRRRREGLQRSLNAPHPEIEQLAEAGFDEWAGALPDEDAADLVDMNAGTPVRWVPGEGWVEASK